MKKKLKIREGGYGFGEKLANSTTKERAPSEERLSHKERLVIQRASRDAPEFSTNYLISPENDETLPWTLFMKDKVL